MPEILIVDDEDNLSYSIQLALKRAGHHCRIANSLEAATAEYTRQLPELILLDMQLPDGNGLQLIERMHGQGIDVPVIVLTAHGTVATAVSAMKHGAADFILKPVSMEELTIAVERCLENRQIRIRLDLYQEVQRRESGEIRIIGESASIKAATALAKKIASFPADPGGGLISTLVLGETGTGKEVIARYIHHNSARRDRPFVQVNCTAIPENLFEAELFGHEKGSFTDAKATKKGLFEMAHEGTLFLDEIGDMPLAMQAKLLVSLEHGRYRRLGATTERIADVRVIAATNSDMDRKVERGEFRADLYYRLKIFTILLAPLREREEDIFLLTDYFVQRFSRKLHKPVPLIPSETRAAMRRYTWPGNVRELRNELQRVILLNDKGVIEPESLAIQWRGSSTAAAAPVGVTFNFDQDDCTLAAVERRLMQAALKHTGGNVSETARLLGLTRGGLRHKLEKLGVTGLPRGWDAADQPASINPSNP